METLHTETGKGNLSLYTPCSKTITALPFRITLTTDLKCNLQEAYLIMSEPYSVIDNRKVEDVIEERLAFGVKVWCAKNLR